MVRPGTIIGGLVFRSVQICLGQEWKQIEKLTVTKTAKEISDLFDLDDRSLREFFAALFSDLKTWLAFASTIGMLVEGKLELTAAAAIAVLCQIGAESFKAAAARRERLRQNDFALPYHLSC